MASLRKRGKVWYVRYRDVHGKQIETKAGPDRSMAQRIANQLDLFNQSLMKSELSGGAIPADKSLIPSVITLGQMTSLGLTADDLMGYGMTFDTKINAWKAPPVRTSNYWTGTPGTPGYTPSGNPGGWHLEMRNGRLKYVRERHPSGGPVAASLPENAAATPSTVLQLRLGSG